MRGSGELAPVRLQPSNSYYYYYSSHYPAAPVGAGDQNPQAAVEALGGFSHDCRYRCSQTREGVDEPHPHPHQRENVKMVVVDLVAFLHEASAPGSLDSSHSPRAAAAGQVGHVPEPGEKMTTMSRSAAVVRVLRGRLAGHTALWDTMATVLGSDLPHRTPPPSRRHGGSRQRCVSAAEETGHWAPSPPPAAALLYYRHPKSTTPLDGETHAPPGTLARRPPSSPVRALGRRRPCHHPRRRRSGR